MPLLEISRPPIIALAFLLTLGASTPGRAASITVEIDLEIVTSELLLFIPGALVTVVLTLDGEATDLDPAAGSSLFENAGSAALPPFPDELTLDPVSVVGQDGAVPGLWQTGVRGSLTGLPFGVLLFVAIEIEADLVDPGQPIPRLASPLSGRADASVFLLSDLQFYDVTADVVGLRIPEPASPLLIAMSVGLALRRTR